VAGWQRPDGGFIVGFDADGEGAFYAARLRDLRRERER